MFDGSIGEFLRELSTLYNALSRQAIADAQAFLPIHRLCDLAAREKWLQGEQLDRLTGYWKQHLGEQPLPTLLPTDRKRSAFRRIAARPYPFAVDAELAGSGCAKELSQREGVTFFMVGLAAFAALLYHYTDQSDVVVGTPIPNRSQPGAQGLIGSFINTAVLRLGLSGRPYYERC